MTNSGDGPIIAAELHTGSFNGVGLIDLRTGAIQPIDAFTGKDFQAQGAFDGEVVVWKEFHSFNGLDDFTVKEWVRRTGKVRTIGRSHIDPTTHSDIPSPWTEPALGGGFAAWVEGVDASGRAQLKVVDTRSGAIRVFSSGHPGGALLIYRGNLIWGESKAPGELTTVFAKSLKSGVAAQVPAALSGVKGATSLATDGTAIAWVGSDQLSLYYTDDGRHRAHVIVRLDVGGFNPPTVVRGDTVVTVFSEGVLAATATGSSTVLAVDGGSATLAGQGFLIGAPVVTKEDDAPTKLAYIPAADLKLSRCGPP